jgi:hypothetical protein
MFELLSRSRPKVTPSSRRRRVALTLEELEARNCPSPVMQTGTVTAPATGFMGGTQTGSPPQTIPIWNPHIDSFTATRAVNNIWVFQGHVTDSSPSATVYFGGLPELEGKTAAVQSDGTFSLSVQLASGESGNATAQAFDYWGLDSNIATFMVMP